MMCDHLRKHNERQITWVNDPVGNNGKTWLAKYLLINQNAAYFTNSRSADVCYSYNREEIIIFDLTRSLEGHVNYSIIEQLKNGILFSSKYKSKTKVFEIPKIIIMANFKPDETKLSQDRWDILNIL
jgi:hypothetical protein